MKKQIRLLIESLFDNEFDDIYNNVDLNSEITDEYMGYSVGDIIYNDNKKPYAICCGDKSDFQNNQPRFMSLDGYEHLMLSRVNINFRLNNKTTDKKKYDKKHLFFKYSNMIHLDEDGYNNTQKLTTLESLSNYPGFYKGYKLSKNYYIPAVDEVSIMLFNIDKLNPIIKKFNGIMLSETEIDRSEDIYWTSTQTYVLPLFFTVSFYKIYNNILDIYRFSAREYNIIRYFVNI